MLTPAQQKIRKELEELHVKGLLYEKNSEPDGSDPSVPSTVKNKPWWIYFGFALVLLASLLIVKAFYTNQRQETAANYLNTIRLADGQSEQLLEKVKQNDARFDIQTVKAAQLKLLQKVKELDEPAGFDEYQEDFIALLEQRLATISAPTQANLISLEVKEELAKDSLKKVLKRQHIPFTENKDGTFAY